MKHKISIGLLLAMLLTNVSCGTTPAQTPDSDDTTASEQVTEAAEPSYDFGGRDYNILCRTDRAYEFDAEETGDIVDDAVFARNMAVIDDCNVNIKIHKVDGEWGSREGFINAIGQSVLSGDDSYQLVAGYNAYITTLITRGWLLDMGTIGIDFSTPWWYNGFNDNVKLGGKTYFALGDASLTMWENLEVMFFNKKLIEDFKLKSPYEQIEADNWTFDVLREYCKVVSADLNNDDIMNEADRWGNIFYNVRDIPVYFGSSYCKLDANGFPKITLYDEHFVDVYDLVRDFLNSSLNARQFAPDVDQKIFSEDRALFFQGPLRYAELLRDVSSDFGIVTFPKLNKSQERYYTTVVDDLSVFCIPTTAKDTQLCAVILDKLCQRSSELIVPAYYESALKVKYSRDDESVRMLDLVRESVWFDTGFIYSQALGGLGSFMDIVKSDTGDVASAWASKKSVYDAALTELIEYIKEN